MIRRVKTHLKYKKDEIEIRPLRVCEEYEVGDWINYYDWIKLGYRYLPRAQKYFDIIYVMSINKCKVGYFMAYTLINVGNNMNIPLYGKELILYDFAMDMRAYVKYSKILIDYMIKYANYNGYNAISFIKEDNHQTFNDFMKKHYNVKEIGNKFYLFIENPRIRSCQKHLKLYEQDNVGIENLYFLYDLKFNICKSKCYIKLQNNESIVVDRKTGLVTFPANVTIKKDNVILNSTTRNIIELVLRGYHNNKIKRVDVYFDINDSIYYEVYIDNQLYISKDYKELLTDNDYKNKLIERGFSSVVTNGFKYDMNESSFSYSSAIYKLKP